MSPSTRFVVIVAVVIVGAAVSILIRWSLAQPKWRALETANSSGVVASIRYYGRDHEVDSARLHLCFDVARSLIRDHQKRGWPHLAMDLAMSNLRIYVMPTNEWVDDWGRKVAGLQNQENIVIGRDFAALAHELAHRCEAYLEGSTDESHASWASNGLQEAVDTYAAWLQTKPWEVH